MEPTVHIRYDKRARGRYMFHVEVNGKPFGSFLAVRHGKAYTVTIGGAFYGRKPTLAACEESVRDFIVQHWAARAS